jgi:disulfide bond formation protein DsbB
MLRLTICMYRWLKKNILYIALLQATITTLGSLYFSEIRDFPPCVLCWYQRVFMFPLVILIIVGILRKDRGLWLYVLPVSIVGWCIALYHNLLYWKILPESIQPCTLGISCTSVYIEWFGFVTIPFLSLAAFTVIIISMLILKKESASYEHRS